MGSLQGRPGSPSGRRTVQTGHTSASSFVSPPYYDHSTPTRLSRDQIPGPRTSTDHTDATRLVAIRQRSPPRKVRNDDYHVRPRIRTNSLDPGDFSTRRPLSIINHSKGSRPIITREVERPSSPLSKTGGAQLEASYIVPASSPSGRHHHRHPSLTTGERLAIRNRESEKIYPSNHTSTSALQPARLGKDERGYNYEHTTPKEQVLRDLAPPQGRNRSGSHAGQRPTSMIELDRSERVYVRTERDAPPPASTRGFESISRNESLKQSNRTLNDGLARRDSASRRYPREERDIKYRDISRPHAGPRDDYVVYPEDNPRHQRPRQPTLEVEAPQRLRAVVDERDEREHGRHRKQHHHHHHRRDSGEHRNGEERHERHHRRDFDGRDERLRRREYDEIDGPERRWEHDAKIERHTRRAQDDNEGKDHRRHYEDRDEREHRSIHDEKGYRVREDREYREDGSEVPSQAGLLSAEGTAAVAGLAAEGVRRHHYEDEEERAHREPHHPRTERDYPLELTAKGGLSEEDEREERRRRRRREREREERYGRETPEAAQRYEDEEREPLRIEAAPPSEPVLRAQRSYERRPEGGEAGRRRRRRRHRHRSPSRGTTTGSEDSGSDSGGSADHVGHVTRVLTPPNDSTDPVAPRPPPKGILKRPREKFPEDPQSVREGVAPLDAAKKGIPPEARWTRINRRLVNPEALEQEGIRFEEYPDYVIVLKVLSQEEIARFTKRTHDIREKRRLEPGSQGSGSGSGDGYPPQGPPPV